MKKLLFLTLFLMSLGAVAQTPPGFKGQVYSDIQDNGYEWVNVDGKQHTIAPKAYFCMAEVKDPQLASKNVEAHATFEKYKIAGVYSSDRSETQLWDRDVVWTTAIWNPPMSREKNIYVPALGWSIDLVPDGDPNDHSSYYITCSENISPKSNMYITASQPDLVNAGLIHK